MYAGNVCDILWCIFLLIYTYIICLILALVADIAGSDAFGSAHITQSFFATLSLQYHKFTLRTLVTAIMLSIAKLIIKLTHESKLACKLKCIRKHIIKYSTLSKMAHFLIFWVASINLFLIVIVNPCIVNPGPPQALPNISVLFQNVRGLIPWTDLGKPSPMLSSTKLAELQAYIFFNKFDIVMMKHG